MSTNFEPNRLTWLRKKRGITKTEIAKRIDKDLRSISAYEAGDFEPSEQTLGKLELALKVKTGFFNLPELDGPSADQVSFRSLSKLSAAKRDMALGNAAFAYNFSDWLEKKFELPEFNFPFDIDCDDPEQIAMDLRYTWGLGEQPIPNMVHLLESKGIKVFSLSISSSEVDACCTWHDGKPFIFLNTQKSNARRRFDAAHELGHIILHRHGAYSGKSIEREANQFASSFLMPKNGFISTKPKLLNLQNIMQPKSTWGVSMAAYIFRSHKLNLITDWQYRTLFKQISVKGYRSTEPRDAPPERSKLAEIYLADLRKDGIKLSDIADELCLNTDDLSDLLFQLTTVPLTGGGQTSKQRNAEHLQLVIDNKQ